MRRDTGGVERRSLAYRPGDFVGKWIGLVDAAAKEINANRLLTRGERQTALERVSIKNSITNLRSFPYVLELERKGELSIYGAWFDISTGELWVMNEHGDFTRPDTFANVDEEQTAAI